MGAVTVRVPHLRAEWRLWQQGKLHVVGVDEVGMGALCAPVVAVSSDIGSDDAVHPAEGVLGPAELHVDQRLAVGEARTRYHVHLEVPDRPGVLAAIAQEFYGGSFLWNTVLTAVILWAGFTAARFITHDAFEGRPAGLTVLNCAHELVTYVIIALIIGLFGISAA